MNQWLLAAIVLTACIVPCACVGLFAGPMSALVAMEVASALCAAVLMLLAESFRRQPFIDLAVVFAVMSLIGAVVFARMLEREL
jgi:multisubunit Na+/H+ antiporter MnhF subunit